MEMWLFDEEKKRNRYTVNNLAKASAGSLMYILACTCTDGMQLKANAKGVK